MTTQEAIQKLSKEGRVIYYAFAGQEVTWYKIRQHGGLSENEIYLGWNSLLKVGLATGQITWGQKGTVLIEHG